MPQGDDKPARSWQDIAHEVLEEKDLGRLLELTKEQRSKVAAKAARARWKNAKRRGH